MKNKKLTLLCFLILSLSLGLSSELAFANEQGEAG